MDKRSLQNAALPPAVQDALKVIGRDIRRARVRRRITTVDLARRCLVSRPTIWKVEKGDPSVSFGTVMHVVWVFGLADRMAELLKDDPVGESLESREARIRARRPSRENEFDF